MSSDSPTPPSSLVPPETPTQRVVLHHIWRRMNIKNEHFMGAIVGREGKAKSHTALKIGELVDPGFTADRVMFDAEAFVERFRGSDLGAGDIVVLDEAGVGYGNRTWQDRAQVESNQALQTARDDNRIIGLTLPRLSELDSQLQGRIHLLFETQSIKDGEWVKVKPLIVDSTRLGRGEEYHKFPVMEHEGRKKKLKSVKIGPPPDDFIENYEPKKADWKDELFADVISKHEGDGDDEDEPEKSPGEVADEILKAGHEKYVADNYGQKYIDADLIAIDFNLSDRKSKKVKKLLKREVTL